MIDDHKAETSGWKRVLRRAGILAGTTVTTALAVAAVALGSGMIAARAVSIDISEAAPPVPVETVSLTLESGYTVTRSFVGQVEPIQQTDLGFELPGTVVEVLVDEGDLVDAGEVIARLDTRSLESQRAAQVAARAALEAQAELAALTTKRQQKLEARGFAATQAFDQARLGLAEIEARIAQTDAAIAEIDVALDKSRIRAPFPARIGARTTDVGAAVAGGHAVVSLLEVAAPRMRVGLSPDLAAGLAPGAILPVEIAGMRYRGRLLTLRPDLDPATRTRVAILEIDVPAETQSLYGQIGTVSLDQRVAETGVWVPVAALQEGTRGLWTVLTVAEQDGQQIAGQEALEILYADDDRAFVRGTFPDGARAIVSGPHRLTVGQSIDLIGG